MSEIGPEQAWQVFKQSDRLYDLNEVDAAIARMAAEINQHHAGTNPILVSILNGGMVLFGRILPQLIFPLETDYIHVSRYRGHLVGKELNWISGPRCDPRDRNIILVDDILDEGKTLTGIIEYYKKAGASDVSIAVLTVKDRKRKNNIDVRYKGLSVPDRYVFGFGMDYKNYLRNVPGIYAEKD